MIYVIYVSMAPYVPNGTILCVLRRNVNLNFFKLEYYLLDQADTHRHIRLDTNTTAHTILSPIVPTTDAPPPSDDPTSLPTVTSQNGNILAYFDFLKIYVWWWWHMVE